MFIMFIVTLVFSVLTGLMSNAKNATKGNLKDFTVPQVGDGDPLIYLAGRVKITSPGLVWYGDFQTKAIRKSTSLFTSVIVGYKYYLGWQLVVSLGPGVLYRKIWFGTISSAGEETQEENDPNFTDPNDPKVPTPIWIAGQDNGKGPPTAAKIIAEANNPGVGTSIINPIDTGAYGGDTGGGGYNVTIYLYGGETGQPQNPYLINKIRTPLIPQWNGIAHLVAHGYIGNSTTLQNMNIEAQRNYDPLGLGAKAIVGTEGDSNPANVIFELLTNNFGSTSIPLSMMYTEDFIQAGLAFWDEDEGISITFGGSGSSTKVGNVITDILRQVDAVLYQDPLDNLIHMTLIRNDYNIDDLAIIDVTNVSDMQSYATNLWSDTKNRVRVAYEDRDKDYDDRVAVGDDAANISFQDDQVKGITVQHPYIKRKEHANRKVAQEMAMYSTPITKLTAAIRRFNFDLRPGSVIKLNYAPYGFASRVMRVLKVNFGTLTNNRMVIDAASDKFAKVGAIFAAPSTLFARPATGVFSVSQYVVQEAPRWLSLVQPDIISADNPRVLALPFAPNYVQSGYNLFLKKSTDAEYVETNYAIEFATNGVLHAAMLQEWATTSITVDAWTNVDDLQTATAGQISTQGLNLLLIDDEFIAYETYALSGSSYVLTTIHRGLLDSVVASHAAGAKVILVTPNNVGSREFTVGDTIDVKMGSISASGEEDVDNVPLVAVI